VDVRRIPFSSFGKRSIAIRTLGGGLFVLQAILRSIMVRGVDAVVVSTSPPIGSFGAVVIGLLHKAPVKYWVMDVNPDQLVALGMMNERALPGAGFQPAEPIDTRQSEGRDRSRSFHG
jgi:hypothetical protein